MTTSTSIQAVEALTSQSGFHTAIFLTYSADLAFFEEAVLNPLWLNGCRNVLVVMDANRYADTIRDMSDTVTWTGRRYRLAPIQMGHMQAFHPKLTILVGNERGRMLIGSGNLTFAGLGRNHELFTCLDWSADQPELRGLFGDAWQLIRDIDNAWGHSNAARHALNTAESKASWLGVSRTEPLDGLQLLHTFAEPLIEQCVRLLQGETVRRLTVCTPFLDGTAQALETLHSRFQPDELRLVVQDETAIVDVQALERLRRHHVPLNVYQFGDSERYLHAKLYIFETDCTVYALSGSPNCTAAAWLGASDRHNLEVALLRHGDTQGHFDYLLQDKLPYPALRSFDELKTRKWPVVDISPAGEGWADLLDVAISNQTLAVSLTIYDPPQLVVDLQLRLSTLPPQSISLGSPHVGTHSYQAPIAPEVNQFLTRPVSAALFGTTADGDTLDSGCNPRWVINEDVLRSEMNRLSPSDSHAADILQCVLAQSEEEWRDLYNTLEHLIVLDIDEIRRQGNHYLSSSPPQKKKPAQRQNEGEDTVILVDADNVPDDAPAGPEYQDAPIHVWFEYVYRRLPGMMSQNAPAEDTYSPQPNENNNRRRWTPKEHLSRRFTNLVRRYVDSLHNPAFTQAVSAHLLFEYYGIFHHIVWLLFKHDVLKPADFVDWITRMNAGFFGAPDEDAPILCPRLREHLGREWNDAWHSSKAAGHAVASAVVAEQMAQRINESELLDAVRVQSLRVLAAVIAVTDLQNSMFASDSLSQAAKLYCEDFPDLDSQIPNWCTAHLTQAEEILAEWNGRVSIALLDKEVTAQAKLLRQARVDYGLARYRVLDQQNDFDRQLQLGTDLVFWLESVDDGDTAQQIRQDLVTLWSLRGNSLEIAKTLYHEGKGLFLTGDREAAAKQFRQALVIAEGIRAESICTKCRQYLGWIDLSLWR